MFFIKYMKKKEANEKGGYLSRLKSIHRKVSRYCKINGLCQNPNHEKMNTLFKLFLSHIGEEVPDGVSRKEFMISLYTERKYSFLCAIISRPEIQSSVWKELTKKVFDTYGVLCLRCGSSEDVCVDHIKPYSIYPELCIEFTNLQPLCRSCNSKKRTKTIDYRKK